MYTSSGSKIYSNGVQLMHIAIFISSYFVYLLCLNASFYATNWRQSLIFRLVYEAGTGRSLGSAPFQGALNLSS
jgi:hypothetical protein